jgi:hypothetical protein
LLPTPQPQVEATAFTLIQAGKHPPDVIVLPTPPVTATQTTRHSPFLQTLLLSPFFLVGVGVLLSILLLILRLMLRRKRYKEDDEEFTEDESFLAPYSTLPVTYSPTKIKGTETPSATFVTPKTMKRKQPKKVARVGLFEQLRLHKERTRKQFDEDEDYGDDYYEA